MLLYYLLAFEDAEQHLDNLWSLVSIATRYGHQPLSEVGRLTLDQLVRFNNALGELIERENKSGRAIQGRMAEGGG